MSSGAEFRFNGDQLFVDHERTNHRKKHHFDIKDDCPFAIIGASKQQSTAPIYSDIKYESKRAMEALRLGIPDWITFHNQVLRFDTRCVETKREQRILYFLEDDTIQLVTPNRHRNDFDGFQATFLRRHRIPLTPADVASGGRASRSFALYDLNVGNTVTIYGRTYEIYDCDKFTRDFLMELGMGVPECRRRPPVDESKPFIEKHRRLPEEDNRKKNVNYYRHHPLKQFLENDGHVLQFYCLWDVVPGGSSDVASGGGLLSKHMIIKYFLADNTVEVREMLQDVPSKLPFGKRRTTNAESEIKRRLKSTLFIRRGKLPKRRVIQPLPVCSPKQKQLVDDDDDDDDDDDASASSTTNRYYEDSDFQLGTNIDVWGRTFYIYGCDEFTREFLAFKYYGLDHLSTNCNKEIGQEGAGGGQAPSPDVIGTTIRQERRFAKEVDEAKIDFVKFMTKDRTADDSHILRFVAKYVQSDRNFKSATEVKEDDKTSRFIVSYHLKDDTISVFERPQRNSGNAGGKFLDRIHDVVTGRHRGKVIIGRETNDQRERRQLTLTDLYVGAKICLNGHRFLLLDCDEYTKNYMEQNCVQFPFANRLAVLQKIANAVLGPDGRQGLTKSFSEMDVNDTGTVDAKTLAKVIEQHVDVEHALSEHELMTLERAYGPNLSSRNDVERVGLNAIDRFSLKNELRKKNFDDFDGLLSYLRTQDKSGTRLMSDERILRSCMAYPLPAKKHLISAVLSTLKQKGDCEYVNYEAFVDTINWKSYPVADINNMSGSCTAVGDQFIDYKKLIEDMDVITIN